MPIVPVRRHPQPAASPVPVVNPRPRIRPVAAQQPAPPSTSEPEHKVGYKSPPLHTRFQKGQSGNRRGRPKGAKALKTMVREILTQKVSVRTPQGAKRMTKMEAMLHKILEQAFSGNLRALQAFIKLYEAAVPDEPVASRQVAPEQAEPAAISAHDQAILDELRASLAAELGEVQ